MNADMNQFRDVFFEESAEHVASMEAALLALETDPDPAELLKQIFRSAHTIKGGSGMFGLTDLGRFTHTMENLLDLMRNGAIAPSAPLVSLLLHSCDTVKDLLASARSGGPPPEGFDRLVAELEAARQAPATAIAEPAAPLAAEPAVSAGGTHPVHRWRIRFTPARDSLRQGLEPLLVLRELATLGTVSSIEVDTRQLPSLEEMDPSSCYLGWRLTLETTAAEAELDDVFAFVERGTEYEYEEAGAGGDAAPEPPAALLGNEPLPAAQPPLEMPNAGSPAAYLAPETAVSQPAADEAQPASVATGPTSPLPSALPRPPAAATTQQTAAPTAQPPAAPMTQQAADGRRAAAHGETTIRVDVGLLDRIMNTVGELVLARNQILQYTSGIEDTNLQAASQRLNLIASELQEGVMKTRMQPIAMVFGMMPRLVRDLAHDTGKQIRLEIEGAETELDRTLLEAIKDPLTHIVRNACDHGVESPAVRDQRGKQAEGRLLLRAYHEGGHVIIEMTDDGGGIDPARVRAKGMERGLVTAEQAARMSDRDAQQLIFLPGFSTAEKVTGISGRGVGMDVVKTNIDRIGGAIDIASQPGRGTTVKLKIPLTLAIIPGLVVNSGGERFVIPQVSLLELVRLEGEARQTRIERVHDAPVYRRRGTLLPLVYLNQILGLPTADDARAVNIIVLQAEEKAFGLVVDDIHDTQEIVVKPLGKQLKALPCYSGATIMGDGHVSLILDVLGVAQQAGLLADNPHAASAEEAAAAVSSERQTLLLFRAAGMAQGAVPLSLVARLEEFPRERVEGGGERQVVQYRDRILPLVGMGALIGQSAPTAEADPLPVIVFTEGSASVGLIVDEILDVVDEEIRIRDNSRRPAVLGSAIVNGRVTDFLDLRVVLAAAGIGGTGALAGRRLEILLAEPSPFQRALIRNDFEMAGYHVTEAASLEEAARKLNSSVDILAADVSLA
jgi:two-component system, chemotaxis family, sensor kinase CheA